MSGRSLGVLAQETDLIGQGLADAGLRWGGAALPSLPDSVHDL